MGELEAITNDKNSERIIQKSKQFLKDNFDWKLALLGVAIMSPIVYAVNKNNGHEIYESLIAAGKQGAYTFFVGGYIAKLSKNLSIKYKTALKAYSASIIIPTLLTIALTYGVHKMKGTPEPVNSTLPTAVLVPGFCAFFSYKERKKTYVLKP